MMKNLFGKNAETNVPRDIDNLVDDQEPVDKNKARKKNHDIVILSYYQESLELESPPYQDQTPND
jgi:hypothetical protein